MSNSWNRPKIKIPKTKIEWLMDIVGYGSYICSVIFLIVIWNQLPDKVPAHFNMAGEVDRWGSKWELIILPFISLFTVLFLQLFERYPEIHNYPKRLNESNAPQFYLLSRKLMNQIKNMSLLIFAFIIVESAAIALEWYTGFGIWFFPAAIVLVMYPIVAMIIKQRKIK